MYIHIEKFLLRTERDVSCNTIIKLKMHLYSGNGKSKKKDKNTLQQCEPMCLTGNCIIKKKKKEKTLLTNVQAWLRLLMRKCWNGLMLNTVKRTTLQSSHFCQQTLSPTGLCQHIYTYLQGSWEDYTIADHTVLELYEVYLCSFFHWFTQEWITSWNLCNTFINSNEREMTSVNKLTHKCKELNLIST